MLGLFVGGLAVKLPRDSGFLPRLLLKRRMLPFYCDLISCPYSPPPPSSLDGWMEVCPWRHGEVKRCTTITTPTSLRTSTIAFAYFYALSSFASLKEKQPETWILQQQQQASGRKTEAGETVWPLVFLCWGRNTYLLKICTEWGGRGVGGEEGVSLQDQTLSLKDRGSIIPERHIKRDKFMIRVEGEKNNLQHNHLRQKLRGKYCFLKLFKNKLPRPADCI